ncbi:TIGR02281 family clan AA aspartic protease [Sphingomonas antarctica]|uniref:hypothetical protein n=1 Tax=Sphingomonas antarctica TaxID=2040274 RepID=UPI0039EC2110
MNAFLLAVAKAAPGIAMLAVFGLLWGGAVGWKRDRKRAVLMVVCAVVILANVLLWTL